MGTYSRTNLNVRLFLGRFGLVVVIIGSILWASAIAFPSTQDVSIIEGSLAGFLAIDKYRQWPLSGPRSLAWKRPPSQNIFELPGRYQHDSNVMENNRWFPVGSAEGIGAEPSPALIEILREGPEAAGPDHGWFANRTVLFLSDSIGRQATEAICGWLNGKIIRYPRDHPLYPTLARELELKHHPGENFDPDDIGRPRECRLEAWNTSMIYHWMMNDDREAEVLDEEIPWSVGGFWSQATGALKFRTRYWCPPTLPTDRVVSIMQPLLENLNRTQVDFVEFSTSAWSLDAKKLLDHDNMMDKLRVDPRWANKTEEMMSNTAKNAASTPLEPEYVEWWIEGTTRLANTIRQTFGPRPPIRYRLLHDMAQHHPYPRLFVPQRTAVINAAARSIPGIQMNDWADRIKGQEDISDWIHPRGAPQWLWAQEVLLALWMAVTDAEDGKRYPMPVEPGM